MTKRNATHKNAVVVGGSGDNTPFGGLGNSGDSDDTTLTPGARDADGNPTVAQFAGPGPTQPWVTNTSRDPVTGFNTDPKNR
jgi:hypothetical protein